MRYGIDITNLGEYADPRNVVRLAQAAEAAGWEALFIWDHLGFVWNGSSCDPWIALAAVAASTERLQLGTSVTPVPRRRPHVLAQQVSTLDVLSRGRTVLGVGLGGVQREYTAFGEPGDRKLCAAMLDEGLEVITQLWSGDRVTHRGVHYTVDGVTLRPVPVQRPRIPIWVGGHSPAALRRAARWDGWVPVCMGERGERVYTPEQLADRLAVINHHRADRESRDLPFEVSVIGHSGRADRALRREYEAAGATLWLEMLHGRRGTLDEMLALTAAGPVR